MTTRKELIKAVGARYRSSPRSERKKSLVEFVALTGCHRKHAITTLSREPAGEHEAATRNRVYGEAVRQAFIMLWEAGCVFRIIVTDRFGSMTGHQPSPWRALLWTHRGQSLRRARAQACLWRHLLRADTAHRIRRVRAAHRQAVRYEAQLLGCLTRWSDRRQLGGGSPAASRTQATAVPALRRPADDHEHRQHRQRRPRLPHHPRDCGGDSQRRRHRGRHSVRQQSAQPAFGCGGLNGAQFECVLQQHGRQSTHQSCFMCRAVAPCTLAKPMA